MESSVNIKDSPVELGAERDAIPATPFPWRMITDPDNFHEKLPEPPVPAALTEQRWGL